MQDVFDHQLSRHLSDSYAPTYHECPSCGEQYRDGDAMEYDESGSPVCCDGPMEEMAVPDRPALWKQHFRAGWDI